MAVFSDFCVDWNEENNKVEEKINSLIKLGYKQVAINNTITQSTKPKGKKDKSQQKQLKPAHEILLPEKKLNLQNPSSITNMGEKLKQLSRLTMVFSDADQIHRLQSPDIQSYDLLAVQPTTEKLFHMACGTLEIDIICTDMTQRMPFRFKRQSLNMAVERGVYFEIHYGPLIRDRLARKNIIANVQMLLEVGRGKNIIISSSCDNPLDLRGPYDVVALGLMLGLSEAKAKQALSTNCNSVLLHAAARKVGRSVVGVTKVENLSEKDIWLAKTTDSALLEDEEEEEDNSSDMDSLEEEDSGSDKADSDDSGPPTKKEKLDKK